METILRILALARKEFLALLKDPRSRTVVIIPPLLQTILFGYAATFDLVDVPYAVFDEDNSAESREFLAGLSGSRSFKLVEEMSDARRMTELIDSRQVTLVVHLGPDFSRRLGDGSGAEVQVILDGRNSNRSSLALNYVASVASDFNRRVLAARGSPAPGATLATRALYNPNLLSRWFFVPGIVVMVTLFVTLLVTSLSVAREREQGTFDQLLVSPYRPFDILVGKAAPGMLIGLVESAVILAIGVFWFEVPFRGQLATLYLGLVLFLLSCVGVGLFISSLSVTLQQGLLGTFTFAMPSVILSGFATPIANMAEPVQWLTRINPLRYALTLVRGVFLEGASVGLLLDQLWPLAVIGLTTLAVAGWLFRRRIS
ncbi:ABC transporter permease [Desulfocurvus sp. DL9XJH121]